MEWSDYYTLISFGLALISMYLLERRGCAEGIEETKAALQYAQEIIEEYNESEKIHTTNLTSDWVCDWCSAFVPGGQYHDCKEGKLK